MNLQKEYNDFYLNVDHATLDLYDGTMVTPGEDLIMNILKPNKIIDLGCGSGRLFNYYRDHNISYLGIDKSEVRIIGSPHREKILNLDLTDPEFYNEFLLQSANVSFFEYDLIVILGGALNAALDEQGRTMMWKSIAELAKGKTRVVLHSFCDLYWFARMPKGLPIKFSSPVPFQYFYSKDEIETYISMHGFKIEHTFIYNNNILAPPSLVNLYYILTF